MSYLKDTNIEAYNQINIELSKIAPEELELLPNNILYVVYWQCNHNPLHIWAAPIFERGYAEIDRGCPFCKNEKFYPNGPNLIVSRRIYSRNRDNIEHRYHCSECNHTWSIIAKDSLTYHDTCIYCSIDFKVPPFKERYKEFLEEWDSQDNLLHFDQIDAEYNYEVKWRCKKCNQPWEATPLDRLYNAKTCPYCSEKLPIPDKTSFAALYPELLSEYIDWEERNPYEIFTNSSFYSNWKCPICHFPYMAQINDKINGRVACPNCSSPRPISVALYDRVISEYNHTSNDIKVPIEKLEVTFKSNLSWICNECHNTWNASLFERLYENKECPYCIGKKVIPGKTSFKAMYPRLVEEYSPINEDDPDYLLPSVTKRIIWNCHECKQEWSSSLNDRVSGNVSCPYCDGRKAIPGKTSFKAMYPQLVEEYSPENEDNPDYLLPSITKRIIWSCHECKQEWISSLNDRVSGNVSCPYCDGRKAIPGKTSFKARHPKLMNEWDSILNLLLVNPDMILNTCNKIVWWKCNECGDKYPMSPARKAVFEKRKQSSCSKCKGMRRHKSHII